MRLMAGTDIRYLLCRPIGMLQWLIATLRCRRIQTSYLSIGAKLVGLERRISAILSQLVGARQRMESSRSVFEGSV